MKERFLTYLRKLVPNPEEAKFLLAVSGGSDSCVLTHLFHSCGMQFDMAHCNFHLRGTDSDEDMQFVMGLSLDYRCGFFLKEFHHEDFQKKRGASIEMIARDLRYQWFEEMFSKYDHIVTAHHANDNAETVLLNLTRGTALKGLTGIPAVNGKIIRPLLHFSTLEILRYINDHQLEFRIDKSNLSEEYRRNKIRLSIIPELEEINPGFIHTLGKNIDILKKQYDFYTTYIAERKEKIIRHSGDKLYIDTETLLSDTFAELLLYEIISEYGFRGNTVEQIMTNLNKQSGKKFISHSHILIKDRKRLILSPLRKIKETPVEIKDIFQLEKYGFEVEALKEKPAHFTREQRTIYIDADKIRFPLFLRKWKNGDVFYPFGMRGRKKVSDFFTDLKIDCFSKQEVTLLCSGEDIVWIAGYRADNRFKLDNKTKNIYKINYYGLL